MKKGLFILCSIFLLLFASGVALFLLLPIDAPSTESPISPTPMLLHTIEAVKQFQSQIGYLSELQFGGAEYRDDKQGGEFVDEYWDQNNNQRYEVEVATDQVVTYRVNRFPQADQPDVSPDLSFEQVEQHAKHFAQQYLAHYDTYLRDAEYTSINDTSAGRYDFHWLWKKPLTQTQQAYYAKKGISPPLYETDLVFDHYGRLRSFGNQFADSP